MLTIEPFSTAILDDAASDGRRRETKAQDEHAKKITQMVVEHRVHVGFRQPILHVADVAGWLPLCCEASGSVVLVTKLIARAVAAGGTDLTEFVVAHLRVAAQRVLADRTDFTLDAAAQHAWESINNCPARALAGLRQLMDRPSPFAQ